MHIRSASFFTTLVLAGSMLPVHAFDITNWFSSLSPRSRGAVYLTAAAMITGVSYLAYKIWAKKTSNSVIHVPSVNVSSPVVQASEAPLVADPEAKRQAEVKEQAAQAETEWQALKTFKLPEEIWSVAVGKDAKSNVIILAGGMNCVYRIDTTTGTFTRLALPAPRLVDKDGVAQEVSERIDALKIVSCDQFVAQSHSHVRLCDMQGNILQQIEDTSHVRNGTYFDGMDADIDKTGTLFVSVTKSSCSSLTLEEFESIKSLPFGNGRMIQTYFSNVLLKNKRGDLKAVDGSRSATFVLYDVYTSTREKTIPLSHILPYLVVDDERMISHTVNKRIQMSSLEDGHCLHEMPLGEDLILSGVVNAGGDYITADKDGALQVWDLKNKTRKTIAQCNGQAGLLPLRGWYYNYRDWPTFQSLDLNRRALGNYHFVSAARDGTVKLWAHTEKAVQEAMDASIAKGFFEYLTTSQPNVQAIIHGYVGSDAEHAFLEIRRDKELSCAKMLAHKKEIAEEEENRLNRLIKLSKEVGLD